LALNGPSKGGIHGITKWPLGLWDKARGILGSKLWAGRGRFKAQNNPFPKGGTLGETPYGPHLPHIPIDDFLPKKGVLPLC